jgi:predicted dehydrogenase
MSIGEGHSAPTRVSLVHPIEIGIGMLGYAFMGRAHSEAYRKIPSVSWPSRVVPKLLGICGRNAGRVAVAAERFGFAYWTTAWDDIIADPDIGVVDNSGPNNVHLEPTLAALRAGKHVVCEKPLGRSAREAKQLRDAALAAGVTHMTGFNYRFLPAVRLMKDLIDEGRLGRIYRFRATYLQSWLADTAPPRTRWRLEKAAAGSGALGDLGSHIIDLSRYLCGEPVAVVSAIRTFVTSSSLPDRPGERGPVDVDDTVGAIVECGNGAIGTLETSRLAVGHLNHLQIEINGAEGSISWDLENLNNLHVCYREEVRTQGFRTVSVTGPAYPYAGLWWPRGHILGWEHSFVHELHCFLDAVAGRGAVAPHGATFEDGYRAAVVVDAILEAADSGKRVPIRYD